MAYYILVVIFFINISVGFSDGLLLTDPAHVEQRFNQLESQIQGLSQKVNTLEQENAALKAQVSSGNSTLVYFSAFLRNTVTLPSVIDVVYDGVRSNYQNSYNPTTGRFTAPVKGLYVFAWETVTDNVFDTELLVNGEQVMFNICNNLAHNGAYVSCSRTAPTFLTPGDIVHIRVVSGISLHGGGWSSFSGWLVHRT